MIWWLALLWAPVSYFLHVAIHEGSHWLAGKLLGYGATLHLLPSRGPDGAIRWGYCQFDRPILDPEHRALVATLPLTVEVPWAVTAATVIPLVPPTVAPLLVVEAVFAGVDCTTWLLGAWTQRAKCDAVTAQETFGLTKGAARVIATAMLIVLWLGIGTLVYRGLT